MNIDRDAAALLAQVIPALLVFLALEDRLSPSQVARRKIRRRLMGWRETAVVLNLASLGFCLWIVVSKSENAFMSLFISVSVVSLLLVLAMLFAAMFAREDEEPVTPHTDATV